MCVTHVRPNSAKLATFQKPAKHVDIEPTQSAKSRCGPILNKALSNASKKTGANLLNTVIRTPEGEIFGGVKMLNLKGNNKAEEIISGGISAFQEGGVVHGRR